MHLLINAWNLKLQMVKICIGTPPPNVVQLRALLYLMDSASKKT